MASLVQEYPGQIQLLCAQCPTQFWTWAHRPGKYCSQDCKYKGVSLANTARTTVTKSTLHKESEAQVARACEVCVLEFWTTPTSKARACSDHCRARLIALANNRPRIERCDPQECRSCNYLKPLVEYPLIKGVPSRCCSDCTPKTAKSTPEQLYSGQVRFECEGCGVAFWRYLNGTRGRFCSKSCKNENHKGKPAVTRTDPQNCAACGVSKPLSEYSEYRGVHSLKCIACKSKPTQEQKRRSHLWIKFKITLEDWVVLYNKQSGLCPICQKKLPELDMLFRTMDKKDAWETRDWNTDHDHDTKKVRGITCRGCNMGLGAFRDDPVALRRAAEYVELHKQHVGHVMPTYTKR